MEVLALHSDVIVFVSQIWQTTCTAVRAPDAEEGFLIDSPVLPAELEAIPDVLGQAGFPLSGLLATHGDWDHLLGPLAFPQAPLGCAESTHERLSRELGAPQRELRSFDEEHYVQRSRPLALGALQRLPVPGKLALGRGEDELELHPAPGHTGDGMAIRVPWAQVLVCGDYLSPVEIPMLSPAGSVAEYRATLERLRPLLLSAEWVIPGHGRPERPEAASKRLEEDLGYLAALEEHGAEAELPAGRRNAAQRSIHRRNVERVRAAAR